MRRLVLLACFLHLPLAAAEYPAAYQNAPLPPELPWSGQSRALLAAADDPWITPAEQSGLTASPDYAQTVAWLQRLVAAAPELAMVSLGKSVEGRDIWLVIASREGAETPAELAKNGKPTLLVQAGIHAGEIDGKDAGFMLLRDMTVSGTKTALLDHANLLFIPILNVDGHERRSPYGRINQRGPADMGWRANARNLNLNRDYTKLETTEIRAVVAAINTWQPDLYFDIHVTDGVDYQYDVTYGWSRVGWSPAISHWLDTVLRPAVDAGLRNAGHVPGPLIFAYNNMDLSEGILVLPFNPRYSHVYGDARHLPTVLVENHALDSYERRVLGTYVLLESVLRLLGEQADTLHTAVAADRDRRTDPLVLSWTRDPAATPGSMQFLGVRSERYTSPVTNAEVVRWTGEPVTETVPVHALDKPAATVRRPAAYYIPAAWSDMVDRLRWHGIQLEKLTEPVTATFEFYRLSEAKIDIEASPFEGRTRVMPGNMTIERRHATFRPGDWRVSTNQPLGDLAVLLLEPRSPDSFFQWGYLLEILQRTEYVEAYIMAPMAERMLQNDADLRRAFEQKLEADKDFATSPRARLQWFYTKTPFFDTRWRLYPVARSLP